MLNNSETIKLSRFISLILRHKPEIIHIDMDNNGWVNVNDLINGIKRHGFNINMKILEFIVNTDDKQRYSFNDDKSKIRANQGHSIKVDVELEEKVPPKFLMHGTGKKYVKSIDVEGLISKSRLYVHLSDTYETAYAVGKRHGESVVYMIEAERMYKDGFKFFQSKNGVWLTESVPPKYLHMYLRSK